MINRKNEQSIAFDVKRAGEILSILFRPKKQWNRGIYNLAAVVASDRHLQFSKLLAHSATRFVGAEGIYNNIVIGRIKQPNIFVPEWTISKDGLERMVYGFDTL